MNQLTPQQYAEIIHTTEPNNEFEDDLKTLQEWVPIEVRAKVYRLLIDLRINDKINN